MVKTHLGEAAKAVKRLAEKIESNGLDLSGDVGLADLGIDTKGLDFLGKLRIEFNVRVRIGDVFDYQLSEPLSDAEEDRISAEEVRQAVQDAVQDLT